MASDFLSGVEPDYVDFDISSTSSDNYGNHILAAAFVYLMEQSPVYGTKVHNHLITQVQEPALDYSQYALSPGSDKLGFSNFFISRLFMVFDYTKELYSQPEIVLIESFFQKAAEYFRDSLHERVLMYRFPNRISHGIYDDEAAMILDQVNQISGDRYWVKRENKNYDYKGTNNFRISDYTENNIATRDYETKQNDAIGFADAIYDNEASMIADQGNQIYGDKYLAITEEKMYIWQGTSNRNISDYTEDTTSLTEDPSLNESYTYVDASGDPHNLITITGKLYSNRNASMAAMVGIWGVYSKDTMMIEHAKVYFEEWLKFHVFPDGTTCEYVRNGDYGHPNTGSLAYSIIMLEAALIFAQVLGDTGDYSLYEFTTSEGLYGTQGGRKNIRKVIQAVSEHCTSSVLRYYQSVSNENLQDTISTFDDGKVARKTPEQAIGIANRYYNEPALGEIYSLRASGVNPYKPSFYYPRGNKKTPWNGNFGLTIAAPLMYY